MKEDEAKQKWCPFIRMETDDLEAMPVASNRTATGKWLGKCIASDCMAWRWDEFINITPEADVIREGYCGLAGKP